MTTPHSSAFRAITQPYLSSPYAPPPPPPPPSHNLDASSKTKLQNALEKAKVITKGMFEAQRTLGVKSSELRPYARTLRDYYWKELFSNGRESPYPPKENKRVEIHYLDDSEKQCHKVLFNKEGQLIWNTSAHTPVKADYSYIYMYVVDTKGDFYIKEKLQTSDVYDSKQNNFITFHHSSFLSGAPVISAGYLKLRNKQLVYIDNTSGHYAPNKDHLKNALWLLKKRGIDLSKVETKIAYPIRSRTSDKPRRWIYETGKANILLQKKIEPLKGTQSRKRHHSEIV